MIHRWDSGALISAACWKYCTYFVDRIGRGWTIASQWGLTPELSGAFGGLRRAMQGLIQRIACKLKKGPSLMSNKGKIIPTDEYPDDLAQEEDDIRSQDDSSDQPPTDIVAFNELRSCADLVRMYSSKQLEIKPDFQRDIVWPNASQTRFIDSLTKQLPIPSMCIGLDYNTNKRLVIDGLQRMWSIIRFLTDDNWRLSTLPDIDDRLSGRRISYIKEHRESHDSGDRIALRLHKTGPHGVSVYNFSSTEYWCQQTDKPRDPQLHLLGQFQ